jgi:acyl-CoA thioester hydrolase
MGEPADSKPPESQFDGKSRSVYVEWTRDIIRYADLDPNGHVNNGAINQYFEDGRVHFRNARMGTLGSAILTGFAIRRFTAEYHAALNYPGTVDVGTVITRIGGSSYTLGQGVFLNERCIATAEVVTVFFDPQSGKSRPLTDELRAVLQGALYTNQ